MNSPHFCSNRWAWISLTVLWAVTRIYPLAQAISWTRWKVWEAKKLLEYGCVTPLIVFIVLRAQLEKRLSRGDHRRPPIQRSVFG